MQHSLPLAPPASPAGPAGPEYHQQDSLRGFPRDMGPGGESGNGLTGSYRQGTPTVSQSGPL